MRRAHLIRLPVGLALALGVVAAAPVAAIAASTPPVYRSPGYKGTRKVPATAERPPAPVQLSAGGADPQVLVDAAGTAHVVWTEGRGEGADVLRYCRLKRGSRTCDNPPATQALVPPATGDPADNRDPGGPAVLSIGDQLILLTHRWPAPFAKPIPHDPDAMTTLMWVSDDGGDSFTGPAVAGWLELASATVFGPADNPSIGIVSDTRGEVFRVATHAPVPGTYFQAIRPGAYASAAAQLGPLSRRSTLGTDQGRPVAALDTQQTKDLAPAGRTVLRRWTGAGDPDDAATWSAPLTVSGDLPQLASGPGGLFLATRNRAGQDTDIDVRRLAGVQARPAVAVKRFRDTELPGPFDLFEDPSGGLSAAWVTAGALELRSSRGGTSWSAPQELRVPGRALVRAARVDVGAAPDGGGFALVGGGAETASEAPIVASAFGSQRPTGQLGLGRLAGGGGGDAAATTACEHITFGSVDLRSPEGCFLKGAGENARTTISNGTVRLNGLEIVPDAGVKVMIDPRAHTLNTSGSVSVILRVPNVPEITLWHGELHVKLDDATSGATLFDFDTDKFAAVLKGFPIDGHITVKLQGDGVVIPVSLKLPKYFGDVGGAATIRADQRTGIHLDSLKIHVGDAFIGPLEIRPLDISYTSAGEVWDGAANLFLPGPLSPELSAHVHFEGNAFRRGDVTFSIFPGVTVFSGVFLHEVGLGLELSPTRITGHVVLGALAVPPSKSYTIDLTGTLLVQLGEGSAPTIVQAGGHLTVAGLGIADALFKYSSEGYAFFTANVGLPSTTSSVRIGGSATIYVSPPHFGGVLKGQACVVGCFTVAGAISDRGVAGCLDESSGPGVVYRWGQGVEGSLTTCYISDILDVPAGAARARAAQATGGRTFTVGRGEPGETLQVIGASGPPSVVLVAPDGRRITPAPISDSTAPVIAGVPAGTNTLYVGLRHPAAGAWSVEPVAGSPGIADLKQARGLSPPHVTARVSGRGTQRSLSYAISGPPGVSVQFVERAAAGLRPLGAPRSGRGRMRFTPGGGRGGRRDVLAAISLGGIVREQRVVAHYTAPAPVRPGAVGGLRVERRGTAVVVRFAAARGAARYVVELVDADGVHRLATATGRRVRFAGVRRGRARVAVRAMAATGRRGPVVRRRLR